MNDQHRSSERTAHSVVAGQLQFRCRGSHFKITQAAFLRAAVAHLSQHHSGCIPQSCNGSRLNITQAAHLKAALAQVSPSLRLNPLDTKQRLERTDHSSLLCSAVCHLDKGTI